MKPASKACFLLLLILNGEFAVILPGRATPSNGPVLPVIPTQSVNRSALLTVTNTATDSNPNAKLSYALINFPAGMVISANGIITWTPSQGPSTNTVVTMVTDTNAADQDGSTLSATNSFNVIVDAPTLAPMPNVVASVGQTVIIVASATDNDPTRTLTYSLDSAPPGASINPSNGIMTWRVGAAFGGTTNRIAVRVTDNSTPPLSDFGFPDVALTPSVPAAIAYPNITHNSMSIQVSGPPNLDYILQVLRLGSTNWVSIQTNTPSQLPITLTDSNINLFSNGFYRVKLSP